LGREVQLNQELDAHRLFGHQAGPIVMLQKQAVVDAKQERITTGQPQRWGWPEFVGPVTANALLTGRGWFPSVESGEQARWCGDQGRCAEPLQVGSSKECGAPASVPIRSIASPCC